MPWTAPQIERVDLPTAGDERGLLQAWLAYHRSTLLVKCSGLTLDQLRQPSAEPSTLTLLGLVRHMTEVERSWFRIRVAGQELEALYYSDADPDGDFNDLASSDGVTDFAAYTDEVGRADLAVETLPLDTTFQHRHGTLTLRWVYLHMIEEYARHNGHADLLRERIDGAVGD